MTECPVPARQAGKKQHANEQLANGTTLLELVNLLNQSAESEAQTIGMVHELLDSGIVRLNGNFRGPHLRGPKRFRPARPGARAVAALEVR